MTLIALFDYKEADSIFMLGDGLVSTEDKPDGNFIMPGAGKVGRPRSRQGHYFHSLEQKLNIIDSSLAFLWSGSRYLAYSFGTGLYSTYKSDGFSFEKLKEYLDKFIASMNETERCEVSLICVFHYKGEYKIWKHGITHLDGYKHFSNLWISGTGRENFLDTIADEYDVITDDNQALGHTLNILNKYYFDDMFTRENYAEAFGGFYELANCSQSGIEKVSDIFITSIHIYTDRLDEGFAVPLTFLKYDVINGLSVIREVRASQSTDGNPDFQNYGHAYLPLIDELREEALIQSEKLEKEGNCYNSQIIGDLSAKHTIVMLNIEDSEHSLKIPLYFRKSDRNGPVNLTLKNGQVEVFLANELLESINRNINRFVDKETKKIRTDEVNKQ